MRNFIKAIILIAIIWGVDLGLDWLLLNKLNNTLLEVSNNIIWFITVTTFIVVMLYERDQLVLKSERLDLALQASADAIWEYNILTKTIYVSPRYYTMLGYDENEISITVDTWFNQVHEGDRQDIIDLFTNFINCEQTHNFQHNFRMMRKDNSFIWVQMKGRIICVNNIPTKIVGTPVDITEKVILGEQAKLIEERFKHAFQNVNLGIVMIDKYGKFTEVNDSFCKMLGFTKEELLTKTFIDISHPGNHNPGLEQFKKLLTGEQSTIEVDKRYMSKDGEEVWVRSHSTVLKDENYNFQAIVSFMWNITQYRKDEQNRIRIERHLQQTQKLEAIGTLASGIAHDFNNILASIIGHTEMLDLNLQEAKIQTPHILGIESGVQRAKDLISQIIAFSRSTDNEEPKPIKISTVLRESIKLLRASIPANIGINTTINTYNDTIMADTSLINQIILNLGANAAYAMRNTGGKLEFQIDNVIIDKTEIDLNPVYYGLIPGRYVKLSVSDTGVGISPEVINRIFDPFFTTKPQGEGSGMGLSIVYSAIKRMGGNIHVSSELSIGTTFYIWLPHLIEYAELQPTEILSPIIPGNGEKILFVDDETTIADLSAKLLEKIGYQVEAKYDPKEAVEEFLLHFDDYAVIITDQSMPGMSGIDLIKEARKIRPDIPVILITGLGDILYHSVKGMYKVQSLSKPITIRELSAAIKKMIG